jgi:hypothetical protein
MPILKNIVDYEGVLDWKYNENLNRLEYLSDTQSMNFEVLITHRLTTWFFSNIQITQNGITGNYSIPDEVFGERTPACIPVIVQSMQKSDESKMSLLEAACKQTLEFLKTDFGLSEVECVAYIDQSRDTVVCEVLLLFNESTEQRFVVDLWQFNN